MDVSVVVFFQGALDHLAVPGEEVLDLSLGACVWKICDIEFCGYDGGGGGGAGRGRGGWWICEG